MSMLNRTTRLHNFADAGVQIQRRRCSISAAEALNFNAVCRFCNHNKSVICEVVRAALTAIVTESQINKMGVGSYARKQQR